MGVLNVNDALKAAAERELDLVEVAPNADPPVCKIMDFGKYKYQMSKKQTHKKSPDVKEVKLRPRIEEHDLLLKLKSLKGFLEKGHKAKVSMMFRGRERSRPELGMKVFDRLLKELANDFNILQPPKHEGNSVTMVVAPK